MPDDEGRDDVDGVRHGPVPVEEPPTTMLTQRLKGTREALGDDRDEPIKSDRSAAVVVTAVVHATWSTTVRRSAITSR